jgi:hypothetical protein
MKYEFTSFDELENIPKESKIVAFKKDIKKIVNSFLLLTFKKSLTKWEYSQLRQNNKITFLALKILVKYKAKGR